GQGYVVVFAENQCPPTGGPCTTATGGILAPGEFGPISYNQLFGSYTLYYNGDSATGACGIAAAPCAPPPVGPNPDEEAANAIAIQSQHSAFSFLGKDTNGALSLTFGTTTAFDYVALPKVVQTDFAVPGAPLNAGPVPPLLGFDAASA